MPPNNLQCRQTSICLPKQKDRDGNACPFVCPITCNNDEHSCSGGTDEKGCVKPDICVQKGTSLDGNLCPGICPIQCEDNEIICKGVELQNGCITGDVCHAISIKCYRRI